MPCSSMTFSPWNARGLMQIVDVLRDYRRRVVPRADERASARWPRPGGRLELVLRGRTCGARLRCVRPAGEEVVERDRPVLGPEAAGRAEVGNAAFGGDAGAGEGRLRASCLGNAAPTIVRSRRPVQCVHQHSLQISDAGGLRRNHVTFCHIMLRTLIFPSIGSALTGVESEKHASPSNLKNRCCSLPVQSSFAETST